MHRLCAAAWQQCLPPRPPARCQSLCCLLDAHPHVAHVARASTLATQRAQVLPAEPLANTVGQMASPASQGTAGVSGLDTRQIQVLLGRSHMN